MTNTMTTKFASLELHGYKTFAKQTNLVFPARITAIVGPNGSGKSNVADAIRWVLGEQSYSLLRAKKTEDMIYIGSEQRARAGMAAVSITFNNENAWLPIDYSEVVLTRRAYRDGQNEYLINNQRVRLKDFHELLGKTGLSDRTYTIIGQGLVDVALSIKPDERRKLFEEAAGIGLYRTRKEEALKRLESTERNLERATDIVDEIKPRLRSLEKQATRAAEFKNIQESLKNKLRDWYGYHWYKAQEEIQKLRNEYETAQTASQKTLELVRSRDEAISQLRSMISEKRQLFQDMKAQLQQVELNIQEHNQMLAVLNERKHAGQQNNTQIGLDIIRLEEAVKSAAAGLETSTTEEERLAREYETLRAQFEKIDGDLGQRKKLGKDLEAKRSDFQRQIVIAEKEIVVVKARLQELLERQTSHQESLSKNEEAVKSLQESERTYKRQHEDISQEMSVIESEIADVDLERQRAQEELAVLKKTSEEISLKINQLNLERNKIKSRLEFLVQGNESLSGFSEGAKALLRHPKLRSEITDLATKLEVQQQFEKAIAAALGEAVDLLVLKNDGISNNLLNELTTTTKERIALINLTNTKPSGRVVLPMVPGVLGNAADVVKAPQDLAVLIELLLNSFVITDNIETAFKVLADSKTNVNVVTLNGEVFLNNGIIKLGGMKESTKVSYSRVKKELEEKISKLDEEFSELSSLDLENKKKMSEINEVYNKNNLRLSDLKSRQEKIRKTLNATELDLEKINGQRKWLEKLISELQNKCYAIDQDMTSLKNRNSEQTSLLKDLSINIEKVRLELSELNYEELEQQHHYLQLETKMMEQSLAHANLTRETREISLLKDQKQLGEYNQRKTIYLNQIVALENQIEEIRAKLKLFELEAEKRLNEQIKPLEEELDALNHSMEEFNVAEIDIQKELTTKERQATQYQLELTRRQEKLETLRARIEDDFGLIELEYKNEHSKVSPLPFPDLVIESLTEIPEIPENLEEEIRQQKAQLRRIGIVNMDAEVEFKEVNARYSSMVTQISDLKEAIGDTQRIIVELDEIMQREFLETFKAVSVEFSRMFARLFNGGSARLILSDETSPIEGGIEIEARLPGKREQGLVLLSGGERSLTAVALVFALLKISPTPFCVLDEVDAMLDESNVGRFIELLKVLSEETQFLLITHNRNTVQAADVIYGVTMGKDSSSQIISLQLEEVDDSFVK